MEGRKVARQKSRRGMGGAGVEGEWGVGGAVVMAAERPGLN